MRYIFLFAMLLTLAVGCNKREKPAPEHVTATVTINSGKDLWISSYSSPINVKCHLYCSNDKATLSAECSADWVTNVVCRNDVINFRVSRNMSPETREATLTAHYGNDSDSITIIQRPYADSEFEAYSIAGSDYYGEQEGGHNYYLILSIGGLSNGGYFYDDNTYYCFDLYAPKTDGSAIPQGTYTSEDGTIDLECSYRINITNERVEEQSFNSVTLTITKEHIEGRLVLDSGKVMNISYNGSLVIPSSTTLSTLEDYYNFKQRDGHIISTPLSNGNTMLYIFDELDLESKSCKGDILQIELTHSDAESQLEGYYMAGIGNNRFVAGYTDESREPLGTWYMTADMMNYAPLKSGSIEIIKEEENYRIIIDAVDDNKHRIYGEYIATLVGEE